MFRCGAIVPGFRACDEPATWSVSWSDRGGMACDEHRDYFRASMLTDHEYDQEALAWTSDDGHMEFEGIKACATTLRANLAAGDELGLLDMFEGLRKVLYIKGDNEYLK